MGLTDGHLAWGDDIPTESEKIYYKQIANLEKENARLLEDCEAYKKAIGDTKAEIKEMLYKDDQIITDADALVMSVYNNGILDALKVIDKHTSSAKMEGEE